MTDLALEDEPIATNLKLTVHKKPSGKTSLKISNMAYHDRSIDEEHIPEQ